MPKWLAIFSVLLISTSPVCAGEKGVAGTIIVHAPKKLVWETVCDTKSFDDTLQSTSGNQAIVEQKLSSLPIMGQTTVLLRTTVFPQERIEYELIKSDRLKALSGTWILTKIDENRTKVSLTSFVDPGLPVPRILVNHFAAGRLRQRLRLVKTLAENAHLKTQKTAHAR